MEELFGTNVDIVFCIDISGSMKSILNMIKYNAMFFHNMITQKLREKCRSVGKLRVKVIGFRDVYVDSVAFEESPFFELPSQNKEYEEFLSKLQAKGGGDEPESGLEALAKAINSEWTQEGIKRRHIIMLFTDASAHKLERSGKTDNYPENMPENLEKLEEMWEINNASKINQQSKRLIIFGPNKYPWANIGEEWNYTYHRVCNGMIGMADMEMDIIMDVLASTST